MSEPQEAPTTAAPPTPQYRTPLPPLVAASSCIAGHSAADLMAPDGSAVDRRLFVDEGVYRLEQERIRAVHQ